MLEYCPTSSIAIHNRSRLPPYYELCQPSTDTTRCGARARSSLDRALRMTENFSRPASRVSMVDNPAFSGDGTGHLFFLAAFLSCLVVAEIVSAIASNDFSCAQTRTYATAGRAWFIDRRLATNSYNKTNGVAFAANSCGTGLWVFSAVYRRSVC